MTGNKSNDKQDSRIVIKPYKGQISHRSNEYKGEQQPPQAHRRLPDPTHYNFGNVH